MSTEDMMRTIISQNQQILNQQAFIMKVVEPLAKGYKPDTWMDREEVKAQLKIGDRRFRELIASGKFEHRGTRLAVQVKRRDIEAYMEGRITVPKKHIKQSA